jgi:hypothetical protein
MLKAEVAHSADLMRDPGQSGPWLWHGYPANVACPFFF